MSAPVIRAVLTDIEGTTSSISFVHDVLFPHARTHLADFVKAHAHDPAVRAQLAAVQTGAASDDAAVSQLLEWMDRDEKATPLKALQGMIWEAGYRSGAFTGHVYADAARALGAWAAAGIRLYVYSSGSVQAQRLLFGHSDLGDLTPLFSGYFDTRVGPKREAASYAAIAQQVGLPPDAILFLSDIGAELDAARAAGLATCQLVRPADGTLPHPGHRHAAGFDQVALTT
ncbi:MAG: acireductone synthase [Nitrospirae bacterium]|nr:acireductone synthase [Nitrospirota bacterium]